MVCCLGGWGVGFMCGCVCGGCVVWGLCCVGAVLCGVCVVWGPCCVGQCCVGTVVCGDSAVWGQCCVCGDSAVWGQGCEGTVLWGASGVGERSGGGGAGTGREDDGDGEVVRTGVRAWDRSLAGEMGDAGWRECDRT